MKRGLFLVLGLGLWCTTVLAQNFADQKVSLSLRQTTLEQALYQLMDRYGIPLSFSNSLLPAKLVTAEIKARPLHDVLDFLLDQTHISYRQVGRQIVLYEHTYAVPDLTEYVTVRGYVRDAATGEPLLSASVHDALSGQGTLTNAYGFFSLRLPRGEARLTCSYLGYEARSTSLELHDDRVLNLTLTTSLVLDEVLVTARDFPPAYARSGYSVHSLREEDALSLPAFGGEPDLLRTAQLLPGVQTGADGFGGLYVRGGDVGQNLVLLDGVPVYNLSHAAGIFSIFNPAMTQTADLIKGVAPARYGGRLSSVLDLRTRDGNNQEFSGQVDLGLISGRLLLEGPLVKGKSSILIAARKSLLNWYLEPITRAYKARQGEQGGTSYGFYDLNAKLNVQLSERDKLFLSVYAGNDHFANGSRIDEMLQERSAPGPPQTFHYERQNHENLRWGNTLATLRWTHLFGPRLFATTAITYSRFRVRAGYQALDSLYAGDPEELLGSQFNFGRYSSGIEDLGARIDLEYQVTNDHQLRFGGSMHRQVYEPAVLQYDDATAELVDEQQLQSLRLATYEAHAYAESDLSLGPRWQVNVGLRGALLATEGTSYLRLEPRLATQFEAGPTTSVFAALGIHTQAVHLLSSSNLGLPIDLWVPSTAEVEPEIARQASLGFQQGLPLGFTLQAEGYIKQMDQLVAYADGAYFINDWRENITQGEGRAMGLELTLQRQEGRTRGWIAYTLAHTERRFEDVNFGRPYPFRYDRRHDLKIALRHRLSPQVELSADWVYGSGLAYSLPQYKISYNYPGVPDQPLDLYVFSEKNQNRLPANHRLDLGVLIDFPERGPLSHSLRAGVYNAYNRQNPLYYDLQPDMEIRNGQLSEGKELIQVTLAPIMPYAAYSLAF